MRHRHTAGLHASGRRRGLVASADTFAVQVAEVPSYDIVLDFRSRIGGDTGNHLHAQSRAVHSEFMVLQGTVGRFMRWGMTHGPAWGVLAAVIGGISLAVVGGVAVSELQLVLIGLVCGIVAGPVLGFAAGVACLSAELVPKWILDAPDYVAVATVAGIVGGVAWPMLELGRSGPAAGIFAVVLITAVPAIDAARSAPRLLYPDESGAVVAAAADVTARGQAS